MRWLVPLLLLTGCTVYRDETPTNLDTASVEQSHYLGEAALPPRGHPAKSSAAQNCGTPDQWKGCARAPRPSVRVFVEVEPSRTP
jgi:hypothetical protein